MRPTLFEISGLKVHSFGAMLVIAFFTAILFAKSRAKRFGLEPNTVYDAAIWALIPGVIGARLFFVVQEWGHYSKHPGEIFTRFEGLTSFGGIVFGAIGLLLWCKLAKKNVGALMDTIAPSFLIAHAIGRIGCLLNGCCHGGHCDLPWAVRVEGETGLFHPAQVYDSLLNVGALMLLLAIERRGLARGGTLAVMLILHGLTRFIYEFWRAGSTSTYMGSLPITDAQAFALAISTLGLFLFMRSRKAPKADLQSV